MLPLSRARKVVHACRWVLGRKHAAFAGCGGMALETGTLEVLSGLCGTLSAASDMLVHGRTVRWRRRWGTLEPKGTLCDSHTRCTTPRRTSTACGTPSMCC